MNEIAKAAIGCAGDATRKLNPHLFAPAGIIPPDAQLQITPPKKKRLRQDPKPLLNKLEARFFEWIKRIYPSATIRPQAKRYRLANGIWYKPDFTAVLLNAEYAWEVKGPHSFRGGFENLKVAASIYPEIRWTLVWFENDRWQEQPILP